MATELQVQPVSVPQSQPRAALVRRPALFAPRLLPALLSGALLWACYFPLSWGLLAWVALVPFLCLVRAEGRALGIYFAAFLGALAFFLPAVSWMSVADYRMVYLWIALAAYCAAYFPAAIFLLRRLDQRTSLPLVVTVPVVWVSLEFLRSFLITGFAWYFLGHTQHTYLAMIQIADITGVYGVSFLIAAVNALLFALLYRAEWFRRVFRQSDARLLTDAGGTRVYVALVAAAFLLALGYGLWRLDQEEFKPGPRVAILQGNLDQRLRNLAPDSNAARQSIGQHFAVLGGMAVHLQPKPDLVIWPETSYHLEWFDYVGMPATPKLNVAQDEILEPVRLSKTAHLLGMNANIIAPDKEVTRYNSALLVTAQGDYSQRYDKMHRLPFGEYMPLRDVFPFLNNFAPYDYDYSISEGQKFTRFALGKYHFGVLICFEDTDPVLSRQYPAAGRDGPGVDFLVNISNDGWFDGSSEHDEHLAVSRFRAIECRRALVRSVNMGISSVIDGNGRVQLPRLVSQNADVSRWEILERDGRVPDLPESRWGEFKKVGGVLIATVPIDERGSLYVLLGDWFAWLCWCVVGGGVAWGMLRRRAQLRPALAGASVVGPVRVDAPVRGGAPRPSHGKA